MRLHLTIFVLLASLFAACAPKRVVTPLIPPNEPGLRVIRAGHATVWIDMAGFRVLTDPVFVGWLGPLPRADALGLNPDALPPVDVAVISHTHMDHYDPWSLSRLPKNAPVLFASAVSAPLLSPEFYMRQVAPRHTRSLKWWQSVTIRNAEGKTARITAVPAAHWAGRLGLDGLWSADFGGWVFESGGYTVYFAGDSGDNMDMYREIAKRFPRIDLALLPIGPVLSKESRRMLNEHINPPQAIEVLEVLGATQMIPMHYGTFFEGPFSRDLPITWLRELLTDSPAEKRVTIIDPGELWQDSRTPGSIVAR